MRAGAARFRVFSAIAAGMAAVTIACLTPTRATDTSYQRAAGPIQPRASAPHRPSLPKHGTEAPSQPSSPPQVLTRAPMAVPAPPAKLPTQLSVDAAHLSLVLFGVNGTIGPDGSMGANLQYGRWLSLGEQDPFGHLLHAAVVGDPSEMASVISAFEYTYAHQSADGSWPSLPIPHSPYPPGGGFVGTAFFYGDLGRGLGLLQDSGWFQRSLQAAPLRARLIGLAPRIALGLRWLATNPSNPSILGMGAHDTNRGAAAAEGFLLVGQWLGNSADVALGVQLLRRVEANQLADGTILESSGFDPGYQVVSLNHLWDIYFHLAASLVAYRPAVWAELIRGLAKEQTVVSSNGAINFSQGSRTGCGGGTYHGEPKTGGGQGLSRVLVYTASTTSQPLLLSEAQSVIAYYTTHSHSHCP